MIIAKELSEVQNMTTAITIIRNDAESNYRFVTNELITDLILIKYKKYNPSIIIDLELSRRLMNIYMNYAIAMMH